MSRIITITSGKGGVGKTSLSLNLSLALASKGFSVCLFDADLGLANVNVLTGMYPDKGLDSVISRKAELEQIMIRDYHGVDIIPGSSGIEQIANLSKNQTTALISSFLTLEDYDYFIFDTSAGISSQVLSFCLTSQEILLVVTKEPTSLTDAYAMLKVLARYKYQFPVKVVVNQVTQTKAAQKAYQQLKKTCEKYLDISLTPLGIIAKDPQVQKAVIARTPFMISHPDTIVSRCVTNLAEKLIKDFASVDDIGLEKFWGRCLAFMERYQITGSEENRRIGDQNQVQGMQKRPENVSSEKEHLTVEKRLTDIEEQIKFLAENILDLKALLKTNLKRTAELETSTHHETWADSRRLTPDPDDENADISLDEPIQLKVHKKRTEPIIVRGKLRDPTDDELANWNEAETPVIQRTGGTQRSIS